MINIPNTEKKRVVIVGCGFAGLRLARDLRHSGFQVVIVDRNNYHQFQPLLYQVATAGLESTSISFPLRKVFHHYKNYFIRISEVQEINTDTSQVLTTLGPVRYDYLILAHGVDSFYFGSGNLRSFTHPMKSVSEALALRNAILQNFEDAISLYKPEKKQSYLNIVVVGGGPSGVEVSGALADMKKFVLPKDYPEMDCSKIRIMLLEGASTLLSNMSANASAKAREYLEKSGVEVNTNTLVKDYDGHFVHTSTGEDIPSNLVIWTAGIKAKIIPGLDGDCIGPGNRLMVDRYNRVRGYSHIFCLGDAAFMKEEKFPDGHPQVAQVALQQAKLLAKNLERMEKNKQPEKFRYRDRGTMATIGRHLAVVDLPGLHFHGFIAWIMWTFIHLMAILGGRNKILTFINWTWSYFTYDESLRLILKPKGC